MVTREMVQNFARPIMEKTLSQLTGPVILHHGGAEFIANLDLLTGFSSTIGYVVDGRDDLSHAREIIGPDQMLIGGPDNISISRLSAEEVENWCNKVLQDRRSDKHFILCNSGPDVLWNTPEENIHAFHRAIQRFRREA
jgi:uroporphyrinogen decarboxylase